MNTKIQFNNISKSVQGCTAIHLIRVENNCKKNHVVLRLVSHANNAGGRGHIKDEELVRALEP